MRRSLPPLPVVVFALVALAPLPLLAAGLVQGGALAWAGLGYMTVLAALIDQLIPWVAADAPEGAEFPAGNALLVALGVAHLGIMPLAVALIAGPGSLLAWERVALFLGFGLWFGQVSVPAAHELIHRGSRGLYGLGVAVYVTLLFGHHASAHRLVHHRHVASALDPNSAREGEGFYRFAGRAWVGSFLAGWRAERALRPGRRITPYTVYVLGAGAALAVAWAVAGGPGVAVWAGLAAHAQMQLLLSDYVQHYGLTRARRADGKLEPVAARHSWNARPWFTSALMLNAPRHSDHHAHPARPYPALRLPAPDLAPMLPWSLPVACSIALVPPLWKALMRPALAPWRTEA